MCLRNRMNKFTGNCSGQIEKLKQADALALVHGDVCDIIYATDLAQKAADVDVFEISGNCPQHLTCIGVLGDTSAVDAAVQKIRAGLDSD